MTNQTRTSRSEQMFQLIEEQKSSGMTKKDFCASKNLAINIFYYWQNKYREHSSDAPTVTILDSIEAFDYGKFVHIMDAEGNKIELWEPVDHVFTEMDQSTTK